MGAITVNKAQHLSKYLADQGIEVTPDECGLKLAKLHHNINRIIKRVRRMPNKRRTP